MLNSNYTGTTYVLPEPLVQGIVHYLNTQPAGAVRMMLNDLEALCQEQEEARRQAERDSLIAQGRKLGEAGQE